jgi:Zn-dependent protease
MKKEYRLGKIVNLSFSIEPSFFAGTIALWIAFSGVWMWAFDRQFPAAIAAGLTATVLYWISEIIHQLGHAYAARQTGYPMVGIRLGTRLIFSTSLYPADEQALSSKIHIRRALGGPTGSLLFSVITGVIALMLYPAGGIVSQMVLFLCLLNFFVFTLGPFIPLGFTDGSTILAWWGKG